MTSTRIVRRAALKDLTGLSLSTIARLILRSEFPRPRQLSSQAVGWDWNDIQSWIESRKAVSQ